MNYLLSIDFLNVISYNISKLNPTKEVQMKKKFSLTLEAGAPFFRPEENGRLILLKTDKPYIASATKKVPNLPKVTNRYMGATSIISRTFENQDKNHLTAMSPEYGWLTNVPDEETVIALTPFEYWLSKFRYFKNRLAHRAMIMSLKE